MTFYKIGEKARDIFSSIHNLINQVDIIDNDPANNNQDGALGSTVWTPFDQYADAITPLEEWALSILSPSIPTHTLFFPLWPGIFSA